jgi:hypothetical protein
MATYRLYWLDDVVLVARADNLTAATDAEACNWAEAQLGTAGAIEVWRGADRIARIGKSQT